MSHECPAPNGQLLAGWTWKNGIPVREANNPRAHIPQAVESILSPHSPPQAHRPVYPATTPVINNPFARPPTPPIAPTGGQGGSSSNAKKVSHRQPKAEPGSCEKCGWSSNAATASQRRYVRQSPLFFAEFFKPSFPLSLYIEHETPQMFGCYSAVAPSPNPALSAL